MKKCMTYLKLMDLFKPLNYTFDVDKILNVYYSLKEMPSLNDRDQICITSKNFIDGTGNLDYKNTGVKESSFTDLHPTLKKTYVEEVYDQVNSIVSVCRIRFMNMRPRTTYRLHKDPSWRLHIPLIQPHGSYYIVNDTINVMPEIGRLYFLNTKEMHCAVNASVEDRLNFMFSIDQNVSDVPCL